jgi:hypothetical protein
MSNAPHSKYRHVYAILRFDTELGTVEDCVTITKVLASEAIAKNEVERLNTLNAVKGARYMVQVTRLIE